MGLSELGLMGLLGWLGNLGYQRFSFPHIPIIPLIPVQTIPVQTNLFVQKNHISKNLTLLKSI
jgi:hypothetical protein